jgi:hypothetical protein
MNQEVVIQPSFQTADDGERLLGMTATELSDILSTDKRTRYAFRGVYMSDQLPLWSPCRSLHVCNTDPSSEPGQHWVIIYLESAERAEYFDSVGCPPVVQRFRRFLDHNATTWRCNTRPVQHPLSDACGHHCLFYSCHRCFTTTSTTSSTACILTICVSTTNSSKTSCENC